MQSQNVANVTRVTNTPKKTQHMQNNPWFELVGFLGSVSTCVLAVVTSKHSIAARRAHQYMPHVVLFGRDAWRAHAVVNLRRQLGALCS